MSAVRPFAMALVVLGVAGCGDGTGLGGSIGESFSLGYDRVQLRKQGESLLIEYIEEAARSNEKVCKVVVDTGGLGLGGGSKLEGDLFREHVAVQRVAYTGGDFPPVTEGRIELGELDFVAGGRVSGSFDVIFELPSIGEQTEERSLYGSFSGDLVEVPID